MERERERPVCLAQFVSSSSARDDEDVGSDCRTERRDCLCREGFDFFKLLFPKQHRTGLL